MEMPIATSDDIEEMREHFAKIRREMPRLHVMLYESDNLIDEHSKAARH